MSTPARPLHRYTYADYLALEKDSPIRHEFLAGEIYAMAVLVSHSSRLLEVWRREASGEWRHESARPGDSVTLASLGCALRVDEVYRAGLVPELGPLLGAGLDESGNLWP